MELTERESRIVDLLREAELPLRISEIYAAFEGTASRRTIIRDVRKLIEAGLLVQSGGGRTTAYAIPLSRRAHIPIDAAVYFAKSVAARHAKQWFNDAVFEIFTDDIFSPDERARLHTLDAAYRQTTSSLAHESPAILRRELERLVIELSWKSSEIEGNTYTLLETEALIKEREFASGKDKAEAQMILNHKAALDYILGHAAEFETLEIADIIKIHGLLVGGLGVSQGFRNHPVGITGTVYRPPGNERRISEAMETLAGRIAALQDPFSRAFSLLVMIAYIQPFEDGNKRTSRIMANAVLHGARSAMLSYRSVEASEYRKAMILFYEQNNIAYLKQIFLDQYEFSVRNYFASAA